jgi:hypothetical protein
MSNGEEIYIQKNKRYIEKSRDKVYLCRNLTCLNQAKEKQCCRAHPKDSFEDINITEVKIEGKVMQYTIIDNERFFRDENTEEWSLVCKFRNRCMEAAEEGEQFCEHHLDDTNYEADVKAEEKEIFTDSKGKKYILDKNESRCYLCDFDGCTTVNRCGDFCSLHRDELNHKPKILYDTVVLRGESIEIKVVNEKKYRRLKDRTGNYINKYRATCYFEDCLNFQQKKEDFCIKHRGGVENVRTEKLQHEKNAEIIQNTQERRVTSRDVNKICDEIEERARKDIASIPGIEFVEKIGQTGDKYTDIKYKYYTDSFWRSVQVKTLSKKKDYSEAYTIHRCNKYGDNLLIIAYSKDLNKERFLLIFSHEVPESGSLWINFDSEEWKCPENMFNDRKLFLEALEERLKHSRKYVEVLTPFQIQERDSLSRLRTLCISKNLSFSLPTESACVYDCIINGYNVQCKTTSNRNRELYQVGIYKHAGMIDGRYTTRPYSENDPINFLIIEILNYPSTFYIVPKKELVKADIFSSSNGKGVTVISVPSPNHPGGSKCWWFKNYIDNWTEIREKAFFTEYNSSSVSLPLIESGSLERLRIECWKKDFSFKLSKEYSSTYHCIIGNFNNREFKVRVECFLRENEDYTVFNIYKSEMKPNNQVESIPYTLDDDFDFLFLEIAEEPGDFYILSKQKLADKGILSFRKNLGKRSIIIPTESPDAPSKYEWATQYQNLWDQLYD